MGAAAPKASPQPVVDPPRERKVVPLAETPYAIHARDETEVVLRCGKDLEVWRKVDTPNKGYAICIDGLEYEFLIAMKAR